MVTSRRLLLAIAVALIATLSGAPTVSAKPVSHDVSAIQVSCWVNVFAWVSTSPSQQGNLSSIVSCNATVQEISQTMSVHDYYTGAIVATVGPVDQFSC